MIIYFALFAALCATFEPCTVNLLGCFAQQLAHCTFYSAWFPNVSLMCRVHMAGWVFGVVISVVVYLSLLMFCRSWCLSLLLFWHGCCCHCCCCCITMMCVHVQGPVFAPLYERLPSSVKFIYDGTCSFHTSVTVQRDWSDFIERIGNKFPCNVHSGTFFQNVNVNSHHTNG